MDTHEAIPHQAGEYKAGGGGTIALFLGLYLLILAFFILLVSISTVEKVKSSAVMDSLSSAFTTILPSSSELRAFREDDGDVLAGQRFQERITETFTSTIQVAKVEIVQPGRLMRVEIPTDSLFVAGGTDIRSTQYPMLDRIVATLSGRPTGLRYDMEFVIGSKYAVGKSLPIGQTLEMARAGAFARAMASRGAPPDSVSIGLMPGDPGEAVIWFYVRTEGETRLTFKKEDFKTPTEKKPEPQGR